ncbi:hypothetical protein CLV70_101857 [Pseudosporangium ferrugineum]|uniref:Uncharacterized protein n=1 Tax=Pseudosporangium ferrugineum TaxID=439699 RepID=A0A2T0SJV8_9ACTN|nr:hypothetical protein CLV70_101857 [Pseudosporangium ferrugineum]
MWFRLCFERLLGTPGRHVRTAPPAEIEWDAYEPFGWRAGVSVQQILELDEPVETYSEEALARLLGRLADLPRIASVEIILNDEQGRRSLLDLSVAMEHRDGWVELFTEVEDEVASSAAGQRDLLAVLHEVAQRSNPSSGSIYLLEEGYAPPLEHLLNRTDGRQMSRQVVRDYGWLTVLAEELGERLGGLPALRASGAFVQVERLAAGGFWLLATPTWDEFGWPEAQRVFEVLAPVLPPGVPRTTRQRIMVLGEAPRPWTSRNLIVSRDPAEIAGV